MTNLTFSNNGLNAEQASQAWTKEYLPTIKRDYLKPLLAKMEETKAAYLNAYCDVLQLIKTVDSERSKVDATVPNLVYGGEIYGKGVMQPVVVDDLYTPAMQPYAIKKICEAYGIERASGWEA